jgi:nitrogen fixation NifU-like protein
VAATAYDDLIMDHIKNARNYRAPEVFDHRASGVNPLCGDEMLVYVKLDGDRIADAAFQCTCCGISMASASAMTELVKGVTVADARRELRDFLAVLKSPAEAPSPALGAEKLALIDTVRKFPARVRCAMLPWVTLEGALSGGHDVVTVP